MVPPILQTRLVQDTLSVSTGIVTKSCVPRVHSNQSRVLGQVGVSMTTQSWHSPHLLIIVSHAALSSLSHIFITVCQSTHSKMPNEQDFVQKMKSKLSKKEKSEKYGKGKFKSGWFAANQRHLGTNVEEKIHEVCKLQRWG